MPRIYRYIHPPECYSPVDAANIPSYSPPVCYSPMDAANIPLYLPPVCYSPMDAANIPLYLPPCELEPRGCREYAVIFTPLCATVTAPWMPRIYRYIYPLCATALWMPRIYRYIYPLCATARWMPRIYFLNDYYPMSPHLNLLMSTQRLTICQSISGVYRYVYIYISLVQTIIKNVFTYTHNKHIHAIQANTTYPTLAQC